MIKVNISQLKKMQKNLNKLKKELKEKACEKIAQSAGTSLLAKTIKKTPVMTGNLKRNWSVRKQKLPDGYEVIVFNQTEYAAYVEYGHRISKTRNIRKKKKSKSKHESVTKNSQNNHSGFVKGRFMLTKSTEEVLSTIEARAQQFIENAIKEKLNDK